jgi:hypothetical protein
VQEAIRQLAAGGTFDVARRVQRGQLGAGERLVLPPSSVRRFHFVREIAELPNGVLGVPMTGNFPAIDAVRQPDALFQMKVGPAAEIKLEPLLEAVRQLRAKNVRLYLVTPVAKMTANTRDAVALNKSGRVVHWPEEVELWALGVEARA